MAQFLLQRLDHAGVLCHAAGHDHLIPDAYPVGKACHPAGHGVVDAVDDIPFVSVQRQLADDLALGKDSAGRADGHVLGGLRPQRPQVLHLHLQHPGHHVQEPAGAGSTLVVHDKVGHDPVLDLEHLHILAPDVDDGVDFRKKEAGSSGVAAQLAHLLVCDLQHGVATVTCGQDIAHVLPLQPGVLQYVADGPLGAAGPRSHGDEGLADQLLAIRQDDALRGGGADIDAQRVNFIHGFAPMSEIVWSRRRLLSPGPPALSHLRRAAALPLRWDRLWPGRRGRICVGKALTSSGCRSPGWYGAAASDGRGRWTRGSDRQHQ